MNKGSTVEWKGKRFLVEKKLKYIPALIVVDRNGTRIQIPIRGTVNVTLRIKWFFTGTSYFPDLLERKSKRIFWKKTKNDRIFNVNFPEIIYCSIVRKISNNTFEVRFTDFYDPRKEIIENQIINI